MGVIPVMQGRHQGNSIRHLNGNIIMRLCVMEMIDHLRGMIRLMLLENTTPFRKDMDIAGSYPAQDPKLTVLLRFQI
jgi:hypothetical protein